MSVNHVSTEGKQAKHPQYRSLDNHLTSVFGRRRTRKSIQCLGTALQELIRVVPAQREAGYSLYTLLFTSADSAEDLCNVTLLVLITTLTHMKSSQMLPCVSTTKDTALCGLDSKSSTTFICEIVS